MNVKFIRLGDIATIISKGTTPTSVGYNFSNTGVPFLRGEDILCGEVNHSNVARYIDNTVHAALSRSALYSGDVLITIAGTIGRIAYISNAVKELNCNQAVAFIRFPSNVIDSAYASFALSAPDCQAKFKEFVAGGAIPNVNLEQIKSLEIPFPSLDEQRRIAARLKAQLAAVEDARSAAQHQLNELTNLANAIIRQSVEHPNTGSAQLGEVLDEVKQGIGTTWANYPVLGATRAGLALAREPVGKSPERYKPVLHGTVFYNPMRIMIGSIAMVDEDDTPGITSPDYVALRGKPGLVDSRWFYYWLRSPYGVRCIASLARGAVRERMLFNRLAEGSIELPSYEVQVAAAKALAELKPMRSAIEQQLAEINLLPSKILAKAFECGAE